MSDSLDFPNCPSCGREMDMELGNVTFDDGIQHEFDCFECGTSDSWSVSELKEMGIERPSLAEFIDYFNISKEDLKAVLDVDSIVSLMSDYREFTQSESLREFAEKSDATLDDIVSHLDSEKLQQLGRE